MRYYQMSGEEVAAALSSNLIFGLRNQEQPDTHGKNNSLISTITGIKKLIFDKFLLLDILPLVCYVITIIFSILNQTWDLLIAAGVALVFFLLSYMGFAWILSIYRRKFLNRLSTEKEDVLVIREGKEQKITVDQLMIGDILLLRKGMILHADARIISAENLYADENFVFSSSIPARKSYEALSSSNLLPEMQENMLWKGSFIAKGSGRAIVTALGENCYIEKTGGRISEKQHSGFYNKQRNIGQFSSLAYICLLLIVFLIAAVCTFRFVELILLLGVMCSFIALNPVLLLTEWNYYRTAELLYQRGAHIRTIEAFDGMGKEKNIYYSTKELLDQQISYDEIISIDERDENQLSYFALCVGKYPIYLSLKNSFAELGIDYEKLDRNYPVYRSEKDKNGVIFSLFANEGKSTVVAAGYWKDMLPYLSRYEDDLLQKIDTVEAQGKFIWLMAVLSIDSIPNQLDFSSFMGRMKARSLLAFAILENKEIAEKIRELKKSKMRTFLVNEHSDSLGEYIMALYGMDDLLSAPPDNPCYSLPQLKKNPYVVNSDASPIAHQRAHVVIMGEISPQDVIYRVKCMFCGIKRSLGFLACFTGLMILTVLTLFLRDLPLDAIIYPMLLIKMLLICPCYYLTETVGNCNQYNRSMILGAFCGFIGLIAALLGFEIAFLASGLSMVILSLTLMISVRRLRPLKFKDVFILLAALVIAVFPWIFLGGNWIAAILFACFPPAASYIINLYY